MERLEMQPPGEHHSPPVPAQAVPGVQGVWEMWEWLWVRASKLRLSQKAKPWAGLGGGRQSFSEAISISLCPAHLILGARQRTRGAISLAGLTLMVVKPLQPPCQRRTGPQDSEIGAEPAFHPEQPVDGQHGLMR